jgi:site-specific DNA recombinase
MASHRITPQRSTVSAAVPATCACPTHTLPAAPPAPAAGQQGLKRAALYARVSTETQEREETVASQVDLLDQAAAASGYDIAPTSVFIDEGVSGTRLDRPALDRLRDLAAEGAFEVLLVTVPDRLARRYAYQVLLVEEFTRCGCEVLFVQHGLGASPEEQMLLQMQGVFAEYEWALIQERTRRGRLFAARQGRVNWGNPPYGYTYIRKTPTTPQHLVINEDEAEVVRLIYRWCGEEQLSAYAIQRRLTAQGIVPRKARHGRWAQSSIIEILRDALYKGEAYYNRTQAREVRQPYGRRGHKDRLPGNTQGRTRRPPSEWIAVPVPAIIDPETWERVQGQRRQNHERAQRHTTPRRYLLRSLLVCGQCGRRMVGSWGAQGGRYICALRYPRPVPGACAGRSLGAPTIEQSVWEHVQALLADPEVLRQQYAQGRGDPAVDVRAEHERARLERKLAALEREKTRLLDAYQAEVIELTELAERRQRLTEQGQQLRARVQEIEQQRLDRVAELRLLEGVDAFCASIRDAMVAPAFEVKQKVLQLVVQRIMVEDHRITIEHVVPSGPIRLQPEHHAAGGPGSLSLSANANRTGTGVLWATAPLRDNAEYKSVYGVLRAFNAETLDEIWNSGTDQFQPEFLGKHAKHTPVTIAHGNV